MSFIKVVFEATGYAYLFDTYSYFPIFFSIKDKASGRIRNKSFPLYLEIIGIAIFSNS